MKKLLYEYKTDDLPNDAITSPNMTDKQIQKYMINPHYQTYTQVDGDGTDDVFYLKGQHFVNRTGVYAFVPIK